MITNGKREIEEHENVHYVSTESSLRMMNFESSFGFDYVQSRVDLPCSMNHFVYTPGTTSEKILEVCREQYMQKYPYKEPKVTLDIVLGEQTCILFSRRIDDVYFEDQNDEREVDDYLDWTHEEPFDDEDYHPGWDRWA